MVMYKTFDEGRNDFTASFTREGLADFVGEHSVPLLDEISPENFALYSEARIPLAYIFIGTDDPNRAALVKSVEPVAREYKGTINFVWIDTNKVRRKQQSLPLERGTNPGILRFTVLGSCQISEFARAKMASLRHPKSTRTA